MPIPMPWLTFDDKTWAELKAFADAIDEDKKDSSSSHRYGENTMWAGAVAERVFSVTYGLLMNMNVYAKRGDSGIDFILPSSETVDVKGTKWTDCSSYGPHLLQHLNVPRSKKADIYVLGSADLENQRGRLIGWATRGELDIAPIDDYHYGPRRGIHWESLRDMDTFPLEPLPMPQLSLL